MGILRTILLLALGFWVGVTWVDPVRGRHMAERLGRGLASAGEALIGARPSGHAL